MSVKFKSLFYCKQIDCCQKVIYNPKKFSHRKLAVKISIIDRQKNVILKTYNYLDETC